MTSDRPSDVPVLTRTSIEDRMTPSHTVETRTTATNSIGVSMPLSTEEWERLADGTWTHWMDMSFSRLS